MVGGFDEPEYIPGNASQPASIRYRFDYVQSALHEVAHWCVAGEARRKLHDYGYWYAPDGRNAAQQAKFYEVESRPQALEWLFSSAAGISFRPSLDNLSLGGGELLPLPVEFTQRLKGYALEYLRSIQASMDLTDGEQSLSPEHRTAKDNRPAKFVTSLVSVSGQRLPSCGDIEDKGFA